MENVVKDFGKVRALNGIDLQIPSGRRIGLIGPNGSGKSTLAKILIGLLSCEGKVRLDGLAPQADRKKLAARISYIPQVAPHFAAPVREVIRLVVSLRDLPLERVVASCRRMELDVDAIAKRPFRHLSGGMKQKLLIAIGVAANADLLILDEPTASLDVEAREHAFDLLAEIKPEATVLLSSHRLEEMRHLIDHVICLDGGSLKFEGPAQSFLARHALSAVEVNTRDPQTIAELNHWGFSPTGPDWFRKVVAIDEKVALVHRLNGNAARIENIYVRDLEAIVLPEEETTNG